MNITRPQLPATGTISRTDLNNLNDLTIELEPEDLSGVADEVVNPNYLRNADFSLWSRGITAVSLTHQARTERADHWWARPDYGVIGSGGSGTFAKYEQAADAAHQQWLYCAKLTGAVNTTSLDFGQDIPARVAAGLEPKITLTLEIENDTGAAITPTVRLDTCNTFESWASVTNRIAQSVDSSVGNAARKTWTVVLDVSGFLSSMRNGAQIYVRFSGVNDVSKFVKVFAAKLELGEDATTRAVERDVEFIPDAAGGTDPRQYFQNSNFAQWLAEEVTCLEDKDTYCAAGWFALASDGSTLVYKRSDVPPDDDSVFVAEVVGETAVTGTVDFGQNIPRPIAGEARHDLVFSVDIFNGTGSAVTPTFRVDTCNGLNTFDDATNRIAEPQSPCADSAWTTLSYTFDASALPNFGYGARIYLRFDAGTLDSVAKSIRISRTRLERGTEASSFVPVPDLTPPEAIGAVFRGLKVTWVDTTHLDVAFDEIVLSDRGGGNLRLTADSYPGVSTGTNGANGLDYAGAVTASTWHYLWLAGTGETSAVFISKNATDPTLAVGYLWRARIGAFYVNGSSEIPPLAIRDRRTYLKPSLAVSDTVPSAAVDTWESFNIANFAPPEAATVLGYAGIHTSADCSMRVAATADEIGALTINGAPVTLGSVINGFRVSAAFDLPQVEAGKLYWQVHVKAAMQYRIAITGYTL